MFAGFEAAFAEIKVFAASALEPGSVNGEHLTAVAPVEGEKKKKNQKRITSSGISEEIRTIRNEGVPDSGMYARHQLHLRQQTCPVGLLREIHNHVFSIGTEG